MNINLMGETPSTTVNGPGDRYLIHVQGCNLACKGCFNPESWSFKEHNLTPIDELSFRVIKSGTDGLSISGGEPMLQGKAVLELLKYLHKDGCPFKKGVLVFTGFSRGELEKNEYYSEISQYVDVFVSGRFEIKKRVYDSLLSSSNQEFIWNEAPGRGKTLITEDDVLGQSFEIILESGELKMTGFPEYNPEFRKDLKSLGIVLKVR